jgi:hypothetical protein
MGSSFTCGLVGISSNCQSLTFACALDYRQNPKCVASVVLLWPGFVATVASCCILLASHFHDDERGPLSKNGQEERGEAKEAKVATQPNGDAPVLEPITKPDPMRVPV